MISVVAREVGVEDESPALLVGFSESEEEEGRDFFFQCDLRNNDYPEISNWPAGETYCVTNGGGHSHYGGVLEARFTGNRFRVLFNEGAIRDLRLEDAEFEFLVEDSTVDLPEVRRQLLRVLTCGRPEYRPQVLEIEP
jgi:hypothetical protein